MSKQQRYTEEFKQAEVAERLGISSHSIYA